MFNIWLKQLIASRAKVYVGNEVGAGIHLWVVHHIAALYLH